MITFKITLNGKLQSKQVPTTWKEITFDQYIKMIALKGNEVELISLFTGIDPKSIAKAKIQGLDQLMSAFEFMSTPPQWTEAPKEMLGVTIPKDITFQSLGPYIDCRHLIQTASSDPATFVESYAKFCAVYIQAAQSGWEGYDIDKAMSLVPEIIQLPAWEVVGLGSFFIVKFFPLTKNTKKASPTTATRPKK
jgi:hypothetical protein